ncbi:ABC transporter ATP-binding protein [Streptomyces hoynatensis]|uniref:ABC transporter ATP-binding protein n=1 Tax=Streptomyces hoynatensis TaxID=1141874 RepID=A0A3A9ZD34_9ACTN|nr:ABC transporter ATP-binding protein [Streptomyces hoynatensis]RKN45959.1 ABC transporter ATP-binding protein [Streptomyces hoynatensis]
MTARLLHKAYGRRQVLRGAELTVYPGQLVAVVGENGAGKSTLLRALAGTLAVDRGEVRVRGRLGYCPQEPVLDPGLTALQHLRYFAAAYRLPSPAPGRALARELDYERYLGTAAGAMSGGTRQKLNLTLALLHDPDVLLLDEPYQGFDWETYLRFWKLVEERRRRGKAVVVITHLVFEQDRFDVLAELSGGVLRPRPVAAQHVPSGHAASQHSAPRHPAPGDAASEDQGRRSS